MNPSKQYSEALTTQHLQGFQNFQICLERIEKFGVFKNNEDSYFKIKLIKPGENKDKVT